MVLSDLQKYALVQCISSPGLRISRRVADKYYSRTNGKPSRGPVQGIITKSLERLIDKELLIGYGRRTPHKWFIESIKLTPKGRRTARLLLGQQQQLPLTKHRHARPPKR